MNARPVAASFVWLEAMETSDLDPNAPPPLVINTLALAKAVRFALVGIVLGLAYINLRWCQSIEAFRQLFSDMLGGAMLPGITVFVMAWQKVFLVVAILIQVAVVCTLFTRRIIGSIYFLGGAALVAMGQTILLYYALLIPLGIIFTKMQGGGP